MRFLADESVDFPIIDILRKQSFDIRSIAEEFPGKPDDFVLATASGDARILITSDKDFGELVYRLKKVSKGVILLRLEELYPDEKGELLLKVLRDRDEELSNAFTVIRKDLVRIRRI